MDYEHEIKTMVDNKNLMNSYKLYFLKSIIMNISNIKNVFEFYELACWMCAYSFKDICVLNHRIRPLDKLYDIILLIIETEELLESSDPLDVFNSLKTTDSKEVRKAVAGLMDYVPYRLLSYLWNEELRGRKDALKNDLIEMYSKAYGNNMYMIVTEGKTKSIVIQNNWIRYLLDNRENLKSWIDNRIRQFVWRDEK